MAMPKTIGATIDLLYSLRETRKEHEAAIKKIREQEDALEAHLMNNFDKAGLDGAKGKTATAALKHSTVADVTDWDAYFTFMAKKKMWALVQKRASITALREMWDDGKVIPGVQPKEIVTLSLTKVS